MDSGTTATYAYDALGHRVLTTVGTTATGFVFNAAGQRVSLWNATTQAPIQGQYYWGSTPVAFHKSSTAHFQHQDWMGTERVRTTYTGAVEGTFTSLPFGDDLTQTTPSGSDTDAYHYGMLDHDYETDTEHAQFRQYSSAQGHWMSPDPYSGSYDLSNPQSMDRYTYALNNPLSFIDPTGLQCVWDDGTQDDSPADGGADQATCEAAGGTWVTATANGWGAVPSIFAANGTFFSGGIVGMTYSSGLGSSGPGCFTPNWLQRKGIAVQQKVAQAVGHPIGFGAGISAGAGFGKGFGFAGTASAQMIVNPNGNAFLVYTYGGSGLTTPWLTLQSKGAGAVGGFQVTSIFPAANVSQSDLQGYAVDGSAGGGNGWGGGGDVSYSGNFQGTVIGPFGYGAFGGAGVVTKSTAIPSCSNQY